MNIQNLKRDTIQKKQLIPPFRMKNTLLVVVLLFSLSISGRSQTRDFYGLYTDRDIYVSGETLLAKIYLPKGIPSRIICLDLVNQNGSRITGASLAVSGDETEGYLQLPDSISSGTYLLRTYQKYNAGKIKTIREIYISNRFDKLEKADAIKRITVSAALQDEKTELIEIANLEHSYPSRNKIDASIRIDESLLKELDGKLLVSIAQTDSSFASNCYVELNDQAKTGMVEKKGIIISGTITDKRTSVPVPDITVYLTVPDSIPGFQYYKTEKDGRFFFLLDKYFGSIQTVIQCFANTPAQRLIMKLDEFYAEAGKFPDFNLQPISEDLKQSLARNIASATFKKVFGQNNYSTLPVEKKSAEEYPYYGMATRTIDPKVFIDLPNFSEISRELLPGVKYRNYNNEPTLQVINNATHYYFEESPLILLDGIPVRDVNVIKDMGTADIKRIDICMNDRFFGDLHFPGVVAVYSFKNDYSRLPETSQLIRLKLETIQLPCKLEEPALTEASVPDMRQILYWNTQTAPAGNLRVECNTSSVLGQFKLSVKGRLKDGTLISSEKQFEVK